MTYPTWYQEAIARGIDFIVIVYEKAEGFVFCPSNLETTFRVGGDYDGSFYTNGEGALRHYYNCLNPAFEEKIAWFIPFVNKIVNKEDFSLDDLTLNHHPIRIIKGRWPW
ncbi:hypothetical protein H6G11_00790 [Cyanobacterium aponinum FACHB-4101]|uniref:hypothetical protein n=1 Tax=Cyanobacterium aponinum TaxID=379064 RepID=UPI001681753D|nr:hypothetical protein [Cyanobacterium aponinum]MBD2392792.1 hypothetical protein [Cyanobacterium aponinum FACHB-4101]